MTDVIEGLEGLDRYFDELERDWNEGISFRPFLEDEFAHLAKMELGFWDTESDPEGRPWKPLAPTTVKKKGHRRILIDTTSLRDSLTSPQGPQGVRAIVEAQNQAGLSYGTDVEYSVYHDRGNENMPARPHVGLTREYLDGCVERLLDYTLDEWWQLDGTI